MGIKESKYQQIVLWRRQSLYFGRDGIEKSRRPSVGANIQPEVNTDDNIPAAVVILLAFCTAR